MKIILLCVSASLISGLVVVPQGQQRSLAKSQVRRLQPLHLLGGDDEERKPLTREEEPEEYFSSDFESLSAEEKIKDPLVIIGLVSIFFPFVLLVIFNSMGLIGI